MKLTKNSNILLLGLSLFLSLVSFTGVPNHISSEAIKTVLVVSEYSENTHFSIKYQNANKDTFVSFSKFSEYSFMRFQNSYSLKEITAFKTYTHHTLWLRTEQIHANLIAFSNHKTRHNDVV